MQSLIHRLIASSLVGAMAMVASTQAAILALEDFDSGLNGWTDRDTLEMAVSWDNVDLWAVGTFNSQTFLPVFEADAFRIDSGTDFVGDYVSLGYTELEFDLYSEDVLPSALFIRLISGTDVFDYQFASINSLNNWQTFSVNLDWSLWAEPNQTESEFNSVLANITALEIQLTRSGMGAQSNYLGGVRATDDYSGGSNPGPGSEAIPEASTVTMIAPAILWLGSMFWKRRGRRGVVT